MFLLNYLQTLVNEWCIDTGALQLEQQPEVLSEEKETQSERAQKFEQNEQAWEHEQLERSQKPKQVENKDGHQNIDKDAKVGKTEMKKAESNKGFVLIIERTQRQRGDDMVRYTECEFRSLFLRSASVYPSIECQMTLSRSHQSRPEPFLYHFTLIRHSWMIREHQL